MPSEMVPGKICLKKNCHHCCIETEMLLSNSDIKSIIGITGLAREKFVQVTNEGYKMLKNKKGKNADICYFLNDEGLCSIYPYRPEGCQFYPIIWDLEKHYPIKDDYCLYYSEFQTPSIETTGKLKTFILKIFGRT